MRHRSPTTAGDTAHERDRADGRPLVRRLAPLLAIAAVALAGVLLYRALARYSLDELTASVMAIPASRLLGAGAFAAASYLCLTGFDALAVRYAGRPLPYPRVALASFVSLSMGHNIGFAALSSGAFRYRFYTRWGLRPGQVAKVILFCGMTVGLGLTVLAGAVLLLRPALVGEITALPRPAAVFLGAGCVAVALGWVGLAATVRRPLRLGRWRLEMPAPRLAAGQIVIGGLNFACVAACLHQTLAAVGDVPYLAVATVYVIANVGALITHVPGGLGVLEGVVMLLLRHGDLIGALLVFRFVYFLVPLALGGLTLLSFELLNRR